MGDELTNIINSVISDSAYHTSGVEELKIGVHSLPKIKKDSTDRNRTSPFAFTGNKFEFRMVGSSSSIAEPNVVLNTAVAEILSRFADRLENAKNFKRELDLLIKETLSAHKRIIFNGNNYSSSWEDEAKLRGLENLRTTVDAVPTFILNKNVELFTKHGVYSKAELIGRCDIFLENYQKVVGIEALTMLTMAKTMILPSVLTFERSLIDLINAKKALPEDAAAERELLKKVSAGLTALSNNIGDLETAMANPKEDDGVYEGAKYYRDVILPAMDELRASADTLETVMPEALWPFPTYTDLLFSVK